MATEKLERQDCTTQTPKASGMELGQVKGFQIFTDDKQTRTLQDAAQWDHYQPRKSNDTLIYTTACRDLENVMLCDGSRRRRDTSHFLSVSKTHTG